jgi:threonyl-tRNA synthetase
MPEITTFLIDGQRYEFAGAVALHQLLDAAGGHDNDNPVVGAQVDGNVLDLHTPVQPHEEAYLVTWIRFRDERACEFIRHSMSHIMSQAVHRLWGNSSSKSRNISQGAGPATVDGFFQDYALTDAGLNVGDAQIVEIEEEMRRIVAEELPISRLELSREDALQIFGSDPLKQQIINRIPRGERISMYSQGEYRDLCRGPHVGNTRFLAHFKLLRIGTAPATSDTGVPLTRIAGTGFPTAGGLAAEINRQKEAARRDHRKIGQAMEIFMFSPQAPGAPFYLKNGVALRELLIQEKRRLTRKFGFEEVLTPTIFSKELWETSGHWEHYKANMFTVRGGEAGEGTEYGLKPMNCPGHCKIFQSRLRSYREMPIRYAEFGHVHRYEQSGVLSGLFRVRSFTQDDSHLFVRPDQLCEETKMLIRMFTEFYAPFGLSGMKLFVSTRPEDRLGTDQEWDAAEGALCEALNQMNLEYKIKPGDGAFYGPKIDFHLSDCIGRTWQCGTIQCDFQLPQRFKLSYVGRSGTMERPIMIHPATMGSLERFMGILIEEFEGRFPLWLAPVQCIVLPISEDQVAYAGKLVERLADAGIRTEYRAPDERLGKVIREVQPLKAPYLLIVGAREVADNAVSVRDRDGKQMNGIAVEHVVKGMQKLTALRSRQDSAVALAGSDFAVEARFA